MDSLETIIGIVLLAGILCAAAICAGRLVLLLRRTDKKLRAAAQSWDSTAGGIIDARVAPRVYFQEDITEAEAQARVQKYKTVYYNPHNPKETALER
jgi:hypothetical protein